MTVTPELEPAPVRHGLSTKAKIGITAAVVAGAAASWLAIRRWHTHWGATPEETRASLPGDEMIPDADTSITHAITIDAPPHMVWPWIAQLGQQKAGFYSYTMLENLVGCEMVNADRVHPEWQNVHEGDPVRFHPKAPPARIAAIEKERHLVVTSELPDRRDYTWAFVLRELGFGQTRFLVRVRAPRSVGLGLLRDEFLIGPAHFVMERKMMLEIKRLAEEYAEACKTPVDEEC